MLEGVTVRYRSWPRQINVSEAEVDVLAREGNLQ